MPRRTVLKMHVLYLHLQTRVPFLKGRHSWQYRLYDNLFVDKPSKLILQWLCSIINETNQFEISLEVNIHLRSKCFHSFLYYESLPAFVLILYSPKVMVLIPVTLLWLKSENSWMSAEQACQGRMFAQLSTGDSVCQQVLFPRQVEEGT